MKSSSYPGGRATLTGRVGCGPPGSESGTRHHDWHATVTPPAARRSEIFKLRVSQCHAAESRVTGQVFNIGVTHLEPWYPMISHTQ